MLTVALGANGAAGAWEALRLTSFEGVAWPLGPVGTEVGVLRGLSGGGMPGEALADAVVRTYRKDISAEVMLKKKELLT